MQSVAWSYSITVVESTGFVDGGMRRNVVLQDCRTQTAMKAQRTEQGHENAPHISDSACSKCFNFNLYTIAIYFNALAYFNLNTEFL